MHECVKEAISCASLRRVLVLMWQLTLHRNQFCLSPASKLISHSTFLDRKPARVELINHESISRRLRFPSQRQNLGECYHEKFIRIRSTFPRRCVPSITFFRRARDRKRTTRKNCVAMRNSSESVGMCNKLYFDWNRHIICGITHT